MKDVCICIIKLDLGKSKVHSIGINNGEGKYESKEGGGYFNLNKNTDIFEYVELTWKEFRLIIGSLFI